MRVASRCEGGVWGPSFAEKLSQGVTWQEIREQLEQHKQERFEAKAQRARDTAREKSRERSRERARDAAEREALKSVVRLDLATHAGAREYFRRIETKTKALAWSWT